MHYSYTHRLPMLTRCVSVCGWEGTSEHPPSGQNDSEALINGVPHPSDGSCISQCGAQRGNGGHLQEEEGRLFMEGVGHQVQILF